MVKKRQSGHPGKLHYMGHHELLDKREF